MGNSIKELVNAFNLNNYFSDKINANFTIEGKKIVGLFASGTNIREYLQGIGEEIIKRHYLSGTEVASGYYNLNCFPFVLGANADEEDLGNGIVKVKLADSTNNEVISNLKVHFANEFKRAVGAKVVARLQKAGVTEEEAYKWIRGTVGTGAIGSPYLYCIAFSDGYLYDSETFEMFREMYIQEFNSRLKECHVKSSNFYEYKDDMLYIKDVSDKVVKSVAEYVRERVALDFRTPGSEESKVENYKNVLNDLIFKLTGKSIYGYDYDDFIDENKIKNGHSFALIPLDNQYETLSFNDARNINRVFNKEIPNGFINGNFISDIKGKTANPQFAYCKEPVYAFSNKHIARLLPIIMQSPIAYNQINGHFEFAVDLERRSLITELDGSRTPPNKKKKYADSGYDSNSPPKKDYDSSSGGPGPSSSMEWESSTHLQNGSISGVPNRHLSFDEEPRSSLEQPQAQRLPTWNQKEALKEFLRQVPYNVGAAEVDAVQNMPAGPSASSQQTNHLSSPPSAEFSSYSSSGSARPASLCSTDSGKGDSLEPGQSPSLIKKFSDSSNTDPEISGSGKGSNVASVPVGNKRPQSLPLTENTPKPSNESPKKQNKIQQFFRNLSIRRSKSNGKATKDILQFDKETFSSFSPGMQKVLSLPLSLDMIRNLFPHLPIKRRGELISLARSEKVKKSHSSPRKIEQPLSSLLPEEQEICLLLFFPDRQNETYVDLSPGAKEQVVLFWEVLRGRGFNSTSSEGSGISSGSTSSDSSNFSDTSVFFDEDVQTKMDAAKTEQLQERKVSGRT